MILQFGGGRFLRGFLDRIFTQTDNPATYVVQSTAGNRARQIADCVKSSDKGRYPVLVRGVRDGEKVDLEEEAQLAGAFVADEDWNAIQDLARDPALDLIVSNGTEAAYKLEDGDTPWYDSSVDECEEAPCSLPAKLTSVLATRFAEGLPPVFVLPCELIEGNAAKMRDLVLEQAGRWKLSPETVEFIESCVWRENLVDCIVTHPAPPHSHPMAVQAEPFGLLALEGGPVPHTEGHPLVRVVDDLSPIALQKVRILNGLHTAMVERYHVHPDGPTYETVRDVLADKQAAGWLRQLLETEIVPTIEERCPEVKAFAAAVLDRFANPFLEHKLADIALNHEAKLKTRLQPTREEYKQQRGKEPPLLAALLGG